MSRFRDFSKALDLISCIFFLSAQVFLSDMLDKWSNVLQVICIWNNMWILVSVAVKSDTFQSDTSCIHLLYTLRDAGRKTVQEKQYRVRKKMKMNIKLLLKVL